MISPVHPRMTAHHSLENDMQKSKISKSVIPILFKLWYEVHKVVACPALLTMVGSSRRMSTSYWIRPRNSAILWLGHKTWFFKYPESKKSYGVRSGNLGGHSVSLLHGAVRTRSVSRLRTSMCRCSIHPVPTKRLNTPGTWQSACSSS